MQEATPPFLFDVEMMVAMTTQAALPIDSTDEIVCKMLWLFDEMSQATVNNAGEKWQIAAKHMWPDVPDATASCESDTAAAARLHSLVEVMLKALAETTSPEQAWKKGLDFLAAAVLLDER